MSYYELFENILTEFLATKPKSIQITTDDFLSDEPVPEDYLEGVPQITLDTQYLVDSDGNYYWPSVIIDVLIVINGQKHLFFTIKDKQAAITEQQYSKSVDMKILQDAIRDNDKEVQDIIQNDLEEYDKDPADDHFTIITENELMTKEVVLNSAKKAISYWAEKYPELSGLPVDFIV